MKEKIGLNPWLSIWVSPRKTMRAITQDDVNYRFIVLCALYGFYNMLQSFQSIAMGQTTSLLVILIAAVVLAIPAGYIIFNFSSFFTFMLGKLIKGKASFKQVRAATSWASVPSIVMIVFWIYYIVAYGNGAFVPGYETKLVGMAATIMMVFGFAQLALGIWGLVIYLHALGEVQGFSAWMALLNLFLALLTIAVLFFLIGWGVSALIHAT
ncbi:MAG: YIP1 family protein [Chlamydiia bacterium]|nr:YIP1 family protein [Chlamydiia bacterium]